MRSEKQVEASASARRAVLYAKLAAGLEQLPDKFSATELYQRAGILRHRQPQFRALIAAMLEQDFKLIRTFNGYWKKP